MNTTTSKIDALITKWEAEIRMLQRANDEHGACVMLDCVNDLRKMMGLPEVVMFDILQETGELKS